MKFEELKDSIRDCFVTGKWADNEDAEKLLQDDDDDDSEYGDFEDLETGERFSGSKKRKHSESEDSEEDEKENSDTNDKEKKEEEETVAITPAEARAKKVQEKREAKKRRMKELFDAEYDAAQGSEKGTFFDDLKSELEQQAQLNRTEFENLPEHERTEYEGFRPGLYVRAQIDGLPCEFVNNFDPSYPVIVGGLLSMEQNIGFVQVRLKKHRWYKKILKTRDPLIISLGWRRFQTIPLYTLQDHNMRNRLLKYTPEHLHCHASFWGPVTPQGTGLLAVQSISERKADFRIAATGTVSELDKSMSIVKKLKLTGTPFKVYKKTAFIEGMFNSSLEVAKFEGAALRSVSGLRGQIKKAVNTPAGGFRATFEDQIKLSDIVFVRSWFPVEPPHFYNPVTTLLMSAEERNQWRGMKTVGELKRERRIQGTPNEDSLYKPIHRKERVQKPVVIPKALQKDLPFKDKPKTEKKVKDKVAMKRVAVVREARERKVSKLMTQLKAIHDAKLEKRKVQMKERVTTHKKQLEKIEERKLKKQKEVKKKIYRALGQQEKKQNKFKDD